MLEKSVLFLTWSWSLAHSRRTYSGANCANRGKRLRLRDQPFRILAALIEKRGEIVTRDELRRPLWSDRVFVEFEAGLNTVISRLRQALNDPAHAPRFIETVPKRGYRFIGVSQSTLNGSPVARREHRPNAEAYRAYLKGHYLIKRHAPPNAQRALEHFREAVRLDPAFVLPYHGAAIYYMMAAVMGESCGRQMRFANPKIYCNADYRSTMVPQCFTTPWECSACFSGGGRKRKPLIDARSISNLAIPMCA